MFRSKVDVDRHVSRTFTTLKTQHERNIRSYSIARLYLDVGDFESCCRYVNNYLNAKNDNPAAHALLAQALCSLGQPQEALKSYQTALTLDPSQYNLILKVCELLALDSVTLNVGSARYWIDRATPHYPNHKAIFTLKQKILLAEGAEPDARMELLEKEASSRPYDSNPQSRFLKSILDNKGALDAFQKAFEVYFDDNRQFKDSILWCETVIDVLNLYKQQNNFSLSWSYVLLRLSVLDKVVELYLSNERAPSEVENFLKQLDWFLYESAENTISGVPSKSALQDLISHFAGQLCMHGACLLLKRAPRDTGGWRESTKNSSILLLLAYQAPPLISTDASFASLWKIYAADRRCQAGYTLLSLFQDKQQAFTDRVRQVYSGPHWREKMYKKLFNNSNASDMKSSYFLTSNTLQEPQLRLPFIDDLKHEEGIVRKLKVDSLHDLVWYGMNMTNLSELDCSFIDGVPLSINNLPNCNAETLNRLDMEAFLYCTILTAKNLCDKTRKAGHMDPDRPSVLPIVVTEKLCTPPQSKWWECARAMSKDQTNTADSRIVLSRGIETVRCSGGHGLDPILISELAKIFETRKNKESDNILCKFLDARAALYYTESVLLLEKLRDKVYVKLPGRKLFHFSKELSSAELCSRIEEGKLYLAMKFVSENENEKAVEILETIKSPYASFHLYKLYKKFADEDSSGDEGYDIKPHKAVMLTKARDNLHVTMERLKLSKNSINDPIFDNLDGYLRCIDLQLPNVDSQSSPNIQYSSAESFTSDNLLQISRRPDPIEQGRSSFITSDTLEAQIKQLVEANKLLVVEVRKMKKSMSDVKNTSLVESPEKLKKIDVSMDEIKHQINEYKDENTLAVAELKDEIAELRKEIEKLKLEKRHDENDLFLLEEENFAANANSVNAGLSYLQRGVNSQPYGIYPPNPLYPLYTGQYPGMSIFPNTFPQDQALYQDLLIPPRSLPPPQTTTPTQVPIPPPLIVPPPTVQPKQPTHNYQIPLPAPVFNPITTSTASFSPVSPSNGPIFNLPGIATSMPQTSTPDKVTLEKIETIASNEQPVSLLKPFSFLEASKAISDNYGSSILEKSLNKSRTLSEKSTDSYDPMPDFKPIIDLPDKIEVSTGEENEEVLFDAPAKLYRLVNGEWKERGTGQMKLLKNKSTSVTRVLMRREKIHKICANHVITQDTKIEPKSETATAYCWVANDFADEILQKESLTARFRTVEVGKKFFDVFCKAIRDSPDIPINDIPEKLDTQTTTPQAPPKSTFNPVGGPVTTVNPVTAENTTETTKPNPFTGFTFGKSSTTSTAFSTAPLFSTSIFSATKSLLNSKEKVLFDNVGELFIYDSKLDSTVNKKTTGSMQVILNEGDVTLSHLNFIPSLATLLQCNHKITENMKFESLNNQSNTIAWSRNQLPTNYAITFDSKDICEQFKNSAIEIQNNILNIKNSGKNVDVVTDSKLATQANNATPITPAATTTGWGDKFKPKPGSWNCKTCYLSNDGSALYCIACENPKDSTIPKKEQKSIFGTSSGEQKFTFGISTEKPTTQVNNAKTVTPAAPATTTTGWGDKFKPKVGSWDCKSCYINNDGSALYCIACENPKDSTVPKKEQKSIFGTSGGEQKFTFGIPSTTSSVVSPAVTTVPSVTPNMPPVTTKSTLFNLPPLTSNNSNSFQNVTFGIPKIEDSNKFSFNIPSAKTTQPSTKGSDFKFVFKPKSPLKVDKSVDSDNEYAEEDDGEHLEFKPVIELPAKVDVVTGEEDEDLIHSVHVKLYKFVKSEWKECGVGDIKLLKHKTNAKYRIVMRRDVVLKVCLNYILQKDTEFIAKDQKAWTFTAIDYSSETVQPQLFCVSFANKDVALKYLEVINEAKADMELNKSIEIKPKDDNDVVFVSEVKATKEQIERARKLQLPDNFYLYEQKSPCTGCVGCNDDSFVFDNQEIKAAKQSPMTPEEIFKKYIPPTASPLSVFSSPVSGSANLFGGAISFDKNIFGGAAMQNKNLFEGMVSENKNIFSSPTTTKTDAPLNTENDDEDKPVSIFSGMGGIVKQPMFAPSLTSEENIFSKPLGPFGVLKNNIPAEESTTVFGSTLESSSLGFSQLKQTNKNIFEIKSNTENGNKDNKADSFNNTKPFSWAGAGTVLFSKKDNQKPNTNENDDDNDDTVNDANYDPVYDPIVPLPDKIEVKTGEEDEELIFRQHSTLYRNVNKEWKVRGVGDLKILYHPQKSSYRLLLRWEKVYKIVLNQLIQIDFQLEPLSSDKTDRSLMWGGLNFTEDDPEGVIEKLAVRFKTDTIAREFSSQIEQIKMKIAKGKNEESFDVSKE